MSSLQQALLLASLLLGLQLLLLPATEAAPYEQEAGRQGGVDCNHLKAIYNGGYVGHWVYKLFKEGKLPEESPPILESVELAMYMYCINQEGQ